LPAIGGWESCIVDAGRRSSNRYRTPPDHCRIPRKAIRSKCIVRPDFPGLPRHVIPMPELPEVETMRRGLLPLLGARLTDLAKPRCRLRPITIQPTPAILRRRLLGQRVTAIERFGKRVALQFESSHWLVFEPRMTGLLSLTDPPNQSHLRLVANFQAGTTSRHLLFWDQRGLGTVRLLADEDVRQRLARERLGPDALSIDGPLLQQRLAHRQIPIKVGLLDQHAVAGIGNLYASEILHLAGIDPRTRCSRVTRAQWERIAAATQSVLRAALAHEGSTLSDGTYRNALNQSGNYQNHHRVYDRAGETCRSCGQSMIQRIVQAQRSTFYCPYCQGRRAKRSPGHKQHQPAPQGDEVSDRPTIEGFHWLGQR
jgi:formamidopyrimidine-DNA glycosylase